MASSTGISRMSEVRTPRPAPSKLVGSGGPVIPRSRGERDRELDVAVEQIALGRERGGGTADALQIVVAGPVALRDGRTWITTRLALAARASERNRRARGDQTLGLTADRGRPQGPSRMGAEWDGDLRQRDAADR